ncbi:MAG TPA: DNA-processing protein DprA [Bacillota bacterium]|nr:DNA-processing protein DprA [Bacillota bacterium]
MEIKKITAMEAGYPSLLKEIPDPPNILYYMGDISLASQTCVAVVGTRKPTDYGKWAAHSLGSMLGEAGIVTVSGMAQGIDTLAHRGALKAAGKTIAVLGNGPDICYPAKNGSLRKIIMEKGLILSEYAPGVHATRFTFPARNRIISGISMATVVVEAGLSSGSLITAERAAEQGREVYALPGNINSVCSIGTNQLIRDGARILAVMDDLLEDFGWTNPLPQKKKESLGEKEAKVFFRVESATEITVDELCCTLGMGAGEVNGIVTILEMKGFVQTSMGKIYVAKGKQSTYNMCLNEDSLKKERKKDE